VYNGGRAAQQAYYVYDELAQNPSQAGKSSSVASLTGKAVARMVSGEFTEASTILTEGSDLVSDDIDEQERCSACLPNRSYPQDAANTEVLANRVPIAYSTSKSGHSDALQDSLSQLRAVAPNHPLLLDLQEKENLFAEALQAQKEAISASS
jgi:coatomer protein complex subunit epsilon